MKIGLSCVVSRYVIPRLPTTVTSWFCLSLLVFTAMDTDVPSAGLQCCSMPLPASCSMGVEASVGKAGALGVRGGVSAGQRMLLKSTPEYWQLLQYL